MALLNRTAPRRWLLIATTMLAMLTGADAASGPPTQEYKIKAVFLFNFAQFVDWPPEAFATAESPFVIGVLGDDPFDGALDDAVRGEKAHGRPLVVQRYRHAEEIGDCHVLFISQAEHPRLPAIMAGLQRRSILTVGDFEGFAKAGGIIRFINDRNRVRLRINIDAAKAANLRISSKLLRPAEIVGQGKEES